MIDALAALANPNGRARAPQTMAPRPELAHPARSQPRRRRAKFKFHESLQDWRGASGRACTRPTILEC